MAFYAPCICEGCGETKVIRSDRRYCSVDCANKHIGLRKREAQNWQTIVCFGDVHIPFEDKVAVELLLQFISREKPDIVVANGDIADQYEISNFSRDPLRKASLSSEIEQLRTFLKRLRDVSGGARIVYICGNHEHRFHRYIINCSPQLAGLKGISFREQAGLDEFGIEFIDCKADKFIDTYWRYENVLFGHFNKVCSKSGQAASYLLDAYGMSLIQAHVHSMGFVNKTIETGAIEAWEGGCLCDLNPHYCRPKNWMQGWHVVHHEVGGSFFHVEPVMIVGHKYRYGGILVV